MNILNTEELLSRGNTAGRRIVLDILEAGLRSSDPYVEVQKVVRIVGNRLVVGRENDPDGREPLVFDLDSVGNIYVIGGGKAAQRQAEALEDILGDRIADGHVNAKKGDAVVLKRIPVTLAGHPLPDAESVSGSERIMAVLRKAKKGDVVFFSESGGGSALMTLPCPGITLDEITELNRLLYFERGAAISDMNAVRTMLGMLRLREIRYCGEATFIQLATDERPPKLRVHARRRSACPSAAESYAYAIAVLERYGCWDLVAPSIREFLQKADPRYAFLTAEERARLHYYRTIGPETMIEAARARASELGLNAEVIASSHSDVEARAAGTVLSFVAQEIEVHDRPLKAPCVLIAGGELVVTVGDGKGTGGRNQEFVLSTVPRIAGSERIVVASVDSDGTDGPTDQAGAIADGFTLGHAADIGIDVRDELRHHNASAAFRRLGDTLYTDVRGSNVQDLRVVYVG